MTSQKNGTTLLTLSAVSSHDREDAEGHTDRRQRIVERNGALVDLTAESDWIAQMTPTPRAIVRRLSTAS